MLDAHCNPHASHYPIFAMFGTLETSKNIIRTGVQDLFGSFKLEQIKLSELNSNRKIKIDVQSCVKDKGRKHV